MMLPSFLIMLRWCAGESPCWWCSIVDSGFPTECVPTSSSDVASCSVGDAAGDPISWVCGNPICGLSPWRRFASRAGEANIENYMT